MPGGGGGGGGNGLWPILGGVPVDAKLVLLFEREFCIIGLGGNFGIPRIFGGSEGLSIACWL